MRKLLSHKLLPHELLLERSVWSQSHLEVELLRRILEKLESLLSNAGMTEGERSDMLEMYRLLLLLEVSKQEASEHDAQPENKSSVDWARLLPLLLAVGVVLGVVVAQLLGLDMRRAF